MELSAELLAKAKEAGVEVTDSTTEEDINKALEAKTSKKKETEDDPEYLKAELKKVIDQRDTAKAERRTLKSKLEEFESKFKGIPKKEDLETMSTELEELRKYREQVKKKEEEEDLKKKSDIERAEINFKKQQETMQKQFEEQLKEVKALVEEKDKVLQENDKRIGELRKLRLEGDILKASAKYNAYSPSQVVKLLVDDFKYDVDLDKYSYLKYEKDKLKDELTVEERVKEFLSDEDNENLIKSPINTDGTGTKSTETPGKSTPTGKGKYNVNDSYVKDQADRKGMTPQELIDIWLLRDAKLEKMQKK